MRWCLKEAIVQREEPVILEKAMSPTGEANNIRRVGHSQPWYTVRSLGIIQSLYNYEDLLFWGRSGTLQVLFVVETNRS